jgi:DNA recombination-dependent growth factor C
MIGQTLSNDRVVEEIAAGDRDAVYRADDEQLDREITLKVLPKPFKTKRRANVCVKKLCL